MRSLASVFVSAALLASSGARLPAASSPPPAAPPRIVAIGDIHGDIGGFTRILQAAGLADAAARWTGGRAVLVQTGDFTDRGEHVRLVMDRLMTLEREAKAAGGRVVVLLGNHEVMNLLAETRDANAPIYATFADAGSEARREAAFAQYQKMGPPRSSDGGERPAVYRQTRDEWMAAHPSGYIEYREALGPGGRYGKWLRDKDMATRVGDTVFLHAGVPPGAAPATPGELNAQIRSEVRRFDRYLQRLVDKKLALPFFTLNEILQVSAAEIAAANRAIAAARAEGTELDRSALDVPLLTEAQEILKVDTWLALGPDRALWYRGFSTLPDDPGGGVFAPILASLGAARFVAGHTPTADRRITPRFGGRVVLIDTGMLAGVYQGRPSALEIDGARLTAIYEEERVRLSDSPDPALVGLGPGGPRGTRPVGRSSDSPDPALVGLGASRLVGLARSGARGTRPWRASWDSLCSADCGGVPERGRIARPT